VGVGLADELVGAAEGSAASVPLQAAIVAAIVAASRQPRTGRSR
jgi:hypothetical protein